MRWRHLFWMMPLLGMLAGVGLVWMEQFNEVSVSGSLTCDISDVLPQDPDEQAIEGIAFMTSERVLEKASFRLASSGKPWWMRMSAASLRSRQTAEIDPIHGAPTIRMTLRGRGGKAMEEIWMTIHEAAQSVEWEDRQARELAQLGEVKREVLQLEGELAALERPSAPFVGESWIRLARSKLDEARGKREALEGNEGGCIICSGVWVVSPPSVPTLSAPFGPMGMLGLYGAVGFGVGAVLAMCLAYAMEVLRPRGQELPV